jgi:hypothetical protein
LCHCSTYIHLLLLLLLLLLLQVDVMGVARIVTSILVSLFNIHPPAAAAAAAAAAGRCDGCGAHRDLHSCVTVQHTSTCCCCCRLA